MKKKSCCKENYLIIISIIIGVIILGVMAFFIIRLLNEEDDSKYNFGLNIEELEKRISKEYLGTISLLKSNATEYESLNEGDKQALKHLVKAGAILENIEMKIDDPHNIPFKEFLNKEIS